MIAIRPMEADADLSAELDLGHRAFGPAARGDDGSLVARLRACVADGRVLAASDGHRQVGSARYYDLRQWWNGRALPLAGVAGVKVAPEARGRGVGRALMTALIPAMAERGYPLALLYPSTLRLYQEFGFEHAGGFYEAEIPARALTSLLAPDSEIVVPGHPPSRLAELGDVAVRRAGPADADEVLAVLGAVNAATLDCGPSTFDVASVRRDLEGDDHFSYLAGDGFLSYYWDGGPRTIDVIALRAASAATTRALWGIVGSHAPITRTVRACVGPRDPIGWLTRERDVETRLLDRWMLRVLDPVAAVAGRGFRPGAEVSVPLRLADSTLPGNAGCYTLTVADGAGRLDRADSDVGGAAGLGARGFAALFAGVPMATLRVAGLADGGDRAADASLDGAFGCLPFMLDAF